MDDHVKSRIMLHGMTKEDPEELVPLANSWLYPPDMQLESGEAIYEPAERAFIVTNLENGVLNGKLAATPEKPVINPAIVLDREKIEIPEVQVNGEDLIPGKDFQHGTVKELEKWKTVIWLELESTNPVQLSIKPKD
jgi:hypothetical protein